MSAVALLAFVACGRTEFITLRLPVADAGVTAVDAGVDAGVTRCLSSPFGVDCCRNGQRVTSAFCLEGRSVCSTGDVCTCNGVEQSFMCVDFCGTDAVAGPDCVNGVWRCANGLQRTTDCPVGTCWGDPGECCSRPRCVDGEWTCAAIVC